MAITPTPQQFTEFAHGARDGEVVMINLLHFARSTDEDRSESETTEGGATAYMDYGDQVIKMIEARGGKIIWIGRPECVLIGDDGRDDWDLVVLVSYPNRGAFIDMVTSPKYERAHSDRVRGLDRTVLLASEPLPIPLEQGRESSG